MLRQYHTLAHQALEPGASFHRPPQRLPEHVGLNNPARDVMTDFLQVAAISMGPCATLVEAERQMIASGVRLLFVIDHNNAILGIVTLNDLQGERPMKYLQEVGGRYEDIFVRDIMTPQSRLDVLDMEDVSRANVGDIVKTLKHMGRQHALVVDHDPEGRQKVRGLFSTTQISRQLGIDIETSEVANAFAEVGAILAS